MKRTVILALVALLSLLLFPMQAFAHSVQTDYRIVSDALEIQSTFSTGEALEGAPVTIYAPNNLTQPWLQGTTDQQGTFSFQPDPNLVGEWSVQIGNEADDHGDMLTVPVSNQGVEIDAISQQPYEAPHKWARQMFVGGAVLSSMGVASWFRWRRRLRGYL